MHLDAKILESTMHSHFKQFVMLQKMVLELPLLSIAFDIHLSLNAFCF